MTTKIKFLAHQVILEVITLDKIPNKYKKDVEEYIEKIREKELEKNENN